MAGELLVKLIQIGARPEDDKVSYFETIAKATAFLDRSSGFIRNNLARGRNIVKGKNGCYYFVARIGNEHWNYRPEAVVRRTIQQNHREIEESIVVKRSERKLEFAERLKLLQEIEKKYGSIANAPADDPLVLKLRGQEVEVKPEPVINKQQDRERVDNTAKLNRQKKRWPVYKYRAERMLRYGYRPVDVARELKLSEYQVRKLAREKGIKNRKPFIYCLKPIDDEAKGRVTIYVTSLENIALFLNATKDNFYAKAKHRGYRIEMVNKLYGDLADGDSFIEKGILYAKGFSEMKSQFNHGRELMY